MYSFIISVAVFARAARGFPSLSSEVLRVDSAGIAKRNLCLTVAPFGPAGEGVSLTACGWVAHELQLLYVFWLFHPMGLGETYSFVVALSRSPLPFSCSSIFYPRTFPLLSIFLTASGRPRAPCSLQYKGVFIDPEVASQVKFPSIFLAIIYGRLLGPKGEHVGV